MVWDGMIKGNNSNNRVNLNLYIYIFLCVRLDDGIEFFSLFVVLSTYRDEKEREGGESVDIVSCDRNYHFVSVRKRVRFFRETTGSR